MRVVILNNQQLAEACVNELYSRDPPDRAAGVGLGRSGQQDQSKHQAGCRGSDSGMARL